jgi:hypothetical protein
LIRHLIRSFTQPFSPYLPKSNSDTAAVVLNEFYPSGFQRVTNHDQCRPTRLIDASFQLADRDDPDLGLPCEVSLAPIEEASGGSALGRRNHGVFRQTTFSSLVLKID